MPDYKPRICFVAPTNYSLLSGREDIEQIGGAEVQRTLLARELVRRGYSVSFVTLDHGQPDGIVHDGIKVFKMYGLADGVPIVRFIHPRWTGLWSAMRRADADLYYQRTAGVESGQTVMWCRRHRRRCLLAIANDPECDLRLGGKPARRERWLYYYGLTRADTVVCQTAHQARMLKDHFDLDATLIRSCAEDPGEPRDDFDVDRRLSVKRVLWIGRFSRQKRLDRLLAVAEQCREFQFDVIGGTNHPGRETQQVIDRLGVLDHVTLHGFIPRQRMADFYHRAALLISTSGWEGYPNTFMEAWSRGIPTVSTLDPDGVVSGNGLGRLGSTATELAVAARQLVGSRDDWLQCAAQARRFFLDHHSVDMTADAYEQLLTDSSD